MGMRNFIAGLMAVLGTILIIAGGAIVIMPALAKRTTTEAGTETAPTRESDDASLLVRGARRVARLTPSSRLILWGIVLLVIAEVAAGAIGFSLSATASGH